MTNDDKYDTAQIRFNPLKVEEFIVYASNIAPIWVGKVLHGIWINRMFEFQDLQEIFKNSNTKARQCIISDIPSWDKFSDSCFLPPVKLEECSHGLYKLKDFLLSPSIRDDTRFNHLENEDNLMIITAYHTSIKKRVIVDGFHRAAALEAEIKNKERFAIPKVTISECYGNLVHTIFPFEFSHLLTVEFVNNAM
jgi:hypothetical protein